MLVRGHMTLPQSEVRIYARELRFEGAGAALDTTPKDKTGLNPNGPGQYGIDRSAGMPGGDVYLYVESIRDDYEWPEETAAELAQLDAELQVILGRLESGLDYFGYPPGWVPNLSFEMELEKFREEMKESTLPTLVLARWAAQTSGSLEAFVNGLNASAEQLLKERGQSVGEYNALIGQIEGLDGEIYAVAQKTDVLAGEPAAFEERLREQAGRNVKSAVRKQRVLGFVKVAADILKVIPHPAAIAIGTGISVAAEVAGGSGSAAARR